MHTSDYLSLIFSLKLQECSFQHKNSVLNLRQRRFVEVQLQPLNYVSEIGSVETHHVFGYARRPRAEKPGRTDSESIFFAVWDVPQMWHRAVPVSTTYGFQHPHGRRGAPLEALTDVVGVGPGPVLEQQLSGFAGPGQRLQEVLHLVRGATTSERKK